MWGIEKKNIYTQSYAYLEQPNRKMRNGGKAFLKEELNF